MAPSSTWRAPGTCPAAYSLAWRTSTTSAVHGGRARPWGCVAIGRPAGSPGVDAAVELADEAVRGRCRGTGGPARRGPGRRRATNTSGRSGSTSQPSQLANAGRSVLDIEPGTCPAANAATGRTSTTSATGRDVAVDVVDARAGRGGAARRSGGVRAGSAREAGRSRSGTVPNPARSRATKLVLVRRRGTVGSWPAHGRAWWCARRRRAPSRTTRRRGSGRRRGRRAARRGGAASGTSGGPAARPARGRTDRCVRPCRPSATHRRTAPPAGRERCRT